MTQTPYCVGRWSLDDLVPVRTGPALERAFGVLDDAASTLESWRGKLNGAVPPKAFAILVRDLERQAHAAAVLDGFSFLWFSEQTSDADALALRQRADSRLADARNRTLFVEHWWKTLDETSARHLLPAAGDAAYYFESLRRFAPYTLTEPAERAINIKNVNGIRGITTVYDMLESGFTYSLSVDGRVRTLTRSELMAYARDPEPEKRVAAYDALLRPFLANKDVLAQLYKYTVSDWVEENVKLRGMASPIAARNLANDLPGEAVDALLEACRENAAVFHRFFRLKARWIGMDRLRRCDLYAPLAPVVREYSFEDAVRLVRRSFGSFDPRLAELAERVFAAGHIDSQPRPGKEIVAFSYSVVPDQVPWVSVNFSGHVQDVSSLVHELGHAVHGQLASTHSVLTWNASLPLGETASNFAQMLLLRSLLDADPDPAFRRYLLARYVDESYAAIVRQAFFALFERDAHRMVKEESATADQLAACYLDNLRSQFGASVDVPDEFRWEWLMISHIYHNPFYCYAYPFGHLLVLALYQQYQREGAAFAPKYLRILEEGGSKAPLAILDEAGFDVRTREFWKAGFDVIAGMIDELESLSA